MLPPGLKLATFQSQVQHATNTGEPLFKKKKHPKNPAKMIFMRRVVFRQVFTYAETWSKKVSKKVDLKMDGLSSGWSFTKCSTV